MVRLERFDRHDVLGHPLRQAMVLTHVDHADDRDLVEVVGLRLVLAHFGQFPFFYGEHGGCHEGASVRLLGLGIDRVD